MKKSTITEEQMGTGLNQEGDRRVSRGFVPRNQRTTNYVLYDQIQRTGLPVGE